MKHTFIEASAGTGKTYKIMELLGEWMQSHLNDSENFLSKVLILTFTEKAAGELKERLRKKIADLKKTSPNPELMNRYLIEIDQVTISTFHGFCNLVLREYPIETNTSTDWVLGDTKERLKEILYNLKHSQWRDLGLSQETLSTLLLGTNFFEKYENNILETAAKILSGRDYLLEPQHNSSFAFPNQALLHAFENLNLEIQNFTRWLAQEEQQNVLVQAGKTTWTEKWESFALFLEEENRESMDLFLGRFFQFLSFPFHTMEQGLNSFLPKDKYFSTKKNPDIAREIQTKATNTCSLLFSFSNQLFQSIGVDAFLQKTTLHLVEKVKDKYNESKWMSYDQMIITVRDAIFNNETLLKTLREKYTVCLLDEFQDTDLLQYEIFKKVFFEAIDGNHFLYLIGDPKQSIYSFRGGDLGTYLLAKSEIADKESIPLTTNRRSVPELIGGYNRIFGVGNPDSSFFPIHEIGMEDKEIHYSEVLAPDPMEQTVRLIEPFLDGPIQIVKLAEEKTGEAPNKKKSDKIETSFEKLSKTTATERWNQFIAYEIQKLKIDQFAYEENGNRKNLQFRDIAILVKNRKDGLFVESELRSQNIPCTYYKQEGIYQSREMDQLQNVFECLLNPNDPASYRKLLLCDLFQINPESLNKFDEHSIDSYEKKRLDSWRKLIKNNQYADFFRRIEEDTRIFYTSDKKDLKWERSRTNYRQILQKLLEFQIANHSNLEELLEQLKKWKIENAEESEQPLFDRETEEDAVQILTIHASKGLEWPIVFIHGFSEIYGSPKIYDYPVRTEVGRRWCLSLWQPNLENYLASGMNEQKRLLYVALTRPKIRLYLPYCHLTKDKSPYHKFLFTSLHAILESSKSSIPKAEFTIRSYQEINKLDSWKDKESGADTSSAPTFSFKPLHHQEFDFRRRVYLHSYSSLKKGITKEITNTEDRLIPLKMEEISQESEGLPSSANTGLFLHSLLENLDFQFFQNTSPLQIQTSQSWNALLKENMERYGLWNDTEKIPNYTKHALHLILNTMRSKIPLLDSNSFSLCELGETERSREMDFHYLFEELKIAGSLGNYLKGSIDLVIFKNDKYYIADYKSDKLASYDPISLQNRIEESHYDLQRDIYAYVFFSYLKSLYGEKEALHLFGGVHYLFLRGMKENSMEGIYSDLGASEEGRWDLVRFQNIANRIENQVSKTLEGRIH